MNIVVLAGGYSTEREVSLTSGSLVANALMRIGHRVLLLDSYLGTEVEGDVLSLFQNEREYHYAVSQSVPDLALLREQSGNGESLIGKNVARICHAADVVFNAHHGGAGEDGRLQGWLDCEGIRYTGTGAIGAALSMDKDITKRILRRAGVATPDWVVIEPQNETNACERALAAIGLPCVVKPVCGGSSVGVSIVENEQQLKEAIAAGAAYEHRLIVEKKIEGREVTVGVLDGRALPIVEIIPHSGFYDYHNKYQAGCATELCPAPLDAAKTEQLQSLTLRAFEALQLRGYARFDYMLDEQGTPWCLEGNALPGMTPTSLLPQMAQAVDMSYDALCDTIVRMALE